MMRSLYSGVSGLNNHQTRMDVIGNNISNVNTTGFKKGRVTFQDILSQTVSGAARPTEDKGGVNPKQVGLGMTVASIDTLHTQGAVQTTGVNTDMAILGEGFFIEQAGSKTVYSRNGAFGLDAEGFLVNPANGFRIQGFGTRNNPDGTVGIDIQSGIKDIEIPIGGKDAAKATTIVRYKSNLNGQTPIIPDGANRQAIDAGTWRSNIEVVDSKGYKQELQLNFTKALDANGNEIPNVWRVDTTIADLQDRPVIENSFTTQAGDTGGTGTFYITFNERGSIIRADDGLPPQGAAAAPAAAPGETPAPAQMYAPEKGRLTVQMSYQIAGSDTMNISLDLGEAGVYDGITQFDAKSTTKAVYQDGRDMGYLQGFMIDDTGVITGSFSNGTKKPLARVALANFTNPGGLNKQGESFYVETNNSGRAMVNAPGEQVAGSIKSGALEMSNVDLAEEFTQMIVTQRGFQANSRTITTSDTLLEELLRLKR